MFPHHFLANSHVEDMPDLDDGDGRQNEEVAVVLALKMVINNCFVVPREAREAKGKDRKI